MNFRKTKKIIIFLFILVLSFSNFNYAPISHASGSAPVIFFSDMTDGPITGFNGSSTQGAAVTIWGQNFGSSGTITVGGQTLSSSNSAQVAEWAVTTNPSTTWGSTSTARGLQRITFYLNSSMSLGSTTIQVTNGGGSSNTVPFYTRNTGNIYFVSTSGNDNNNGKTTSTPWASMGKMRSSLQAGDVAYLRTGTWNTLDSSYGSRGLAVLDFEGNGSNAFNNGSANNTITVAAYPGETPTLDASNFYDNNPGVGTPAIYIGYYTYAQMKYWTFSKLILHSKGEVFMGKGGGEGADYLRLIGLDISASYTPYGSWGFDWPQGENSGTLLSVYGCNFHDLNQDYHGQGYVGTWIDFQGRSYHIYIEGYGTIATVDIGWNEFGYNPMGRAFQIYGHLATDNLGTLYFHDNYSHDFGMNSDIGGGDSGFYTFITNAYIYNNIWRKSTSYPDQNDTTSWDVLALASTGGGMTNCYVYNNTFYRTSDDATRIFDIGSQSQTNISNFVFRNNIIVGVPNSYNYAVNNVPSTTADHNLYYGCGAGAAPSWDTSMLTNNNPLFAVLSPTVLTDFGLQGNSPAISAGYNLTTSYPRDIMGVIRSIPQSIGAFEPSGGSSDTTPPATPSGLSVY